MVSRATDPEEPTPEVLQWCENLMRTIQHGGVWGIPRSGTTFRVDQEKKQLVLLIPGRDDDADFNATKDVFKHIGWEVVKKA